MLREAVSMVWKLALITALSIALWLLITIFAQLSAGLVD